MHHAGVGAGAVHVEARRARRGGREQRDAEADPARGAAEVRT
jgi:hypothetical protein